MNRSDTHWLGETDAHYRARLRMLGDNQENARSTRLLFCASAVQYIRDNPLLIRDEQFRRILRSRIVGLSDHNTDVIQTYGTQRQYMAEMVYGRVRYPGLVTPGPQAACVTCSMLTSFIRDGHRTCPLCNFAANELGASSVLDTPAERSVPDRVDENQPYLIEWGPRTGQIPAPPAHIGVDHAGVGTDRTAVTRSSRTHRTIARPLGRRCTPEYADPNSATGNSYDFTDNTGLSAPYGTARPVLAYMDCCNGESSITLDYCIHNEHCVRFMEGDQPTNNMVIEHYGVRYLIESVTKIDMYSPEGRFTLHRFECRVSPLRDVMLRSVNGDGPRLTIAYIGTQTPGIAGKDKNNGWSVKGSISNVRDGRKCLSAQREAIDNDPNAVYMARIRDTARELPGFIDFTFVCRFVEVPANEEFAGEIRAVLLLKDEIALLHTAQRNIKLPGTTNWLPGQVIEIVSVLSRQEVEILKQKHSPKRRIDLDD